jgi:hypothetical protein
MSTGKFAVNVSGTITDDAHYITRREIKNDVYQEI